VRTGRRESEGVTQQRSPHVLRAIHWVRMDEHYPWNSLSSRYVATELEAEERPWGPYYVGTYDLADIKRSGALFIRKTSMLVDPNLFHLLPVASHAAVPNISWPPHVRVKQGAVKSGAVMANGCVRVAESIHCPPSHALREDVAAAKAAVEAASRKEL